MAQFAFDYTFWMNLAFAALAGVLVWLHRRHRRAQQDGGGHRHGGGISLKRGIAFFCIALLAGGLAVFWMS